MGILKNPGAKPNTVSSAPGRRKAGAESLAATAQGAAFNLLVSTIAERYGVKVAGDAEPVRNPYAMTPAEAAKVARRAGIITSSGKLSPLFK